MAGFFAAPAAKAQQKAERKAESSNMELVGYNDLQARSAYQPVIEKQGARWIAYIGHHAGVQPNALTGQDESNGTSVVDVTDPKHPKYIAHIPGEPIRPGGGGDAGGVTDPSKPSRITTIVSGLRDTHKSWWECDTGIAYIVGGAPGWRTPRMAMIYDLSDPAKPVFIRNFGLPGQQPGAIGGSTEH